MMIHTHSNEPRVGMLVFANDGGLGAQTRRLCHMIKPYRILAIDSTNFSKNKKQHWEWYDGFNGYKTKGFPTLKEIRVFLDGLTHVLCCENPLNFGLISEAERRGIKTFIQSNYEFCDNLANPAYPVPTKFLMPSTWMLEQMKLRFGPDRVEYLPPPIDFNEFKEVRNRNLMRSPDQVNLLHVVGTIAAHDRNGTLDLIKALPYCKSDFILTIKSQHQIPDEYYTQDSRVRYKIGSEPSAENLYDGFDALILPRRYGGLCLPMWEAMASGLVIAMTDISPNNSYIPERYLAKAHKVDQFMARTMIDLYESDVYDLAAVVDRIAEEKNIDISKMDAVELAHNTVSSTHLANKYEKLWR